MYSRYGDNDKRPIRLPEHYGGSAFSQRSTEQPQIPKKEPVRSFPRDGVGEKASPVADRLLRSETAEKRKIELPPEPSIPDIPSHPEEAIEEKEEKISNINHQEINTTNIQPAQPMIQKYEQVHKQIETLINRAFLSGQFQYKKVSDVYKKLYNVLPLTEENLIKIQKIQTIVREYFKSETNTFPLLQKQLQNASSMEEEIQIFLSYYQE